MPSTIRDLTELTTVASDDYLLISDTSDVTNRDKRISRANLFSGFALKTGTPVAARVASWADANTVQDGGFAVSDISRLSVAQTISAVKAFSAGLTLGAGTDVLSIHSKGTWTPTISSTGTAPTVTYGAQAGQYTQIGNVVFYNFSFNCTAISGGTGQYRISLPSAPVGVQALGVMHLIGVDVPGTPVTQVFRVEIGAAFGRVVFTNDNAADTALTAPSQTVACTFQATGYYFV